MLDNYSPSLLFPDLADVGTSCDNSFAPLKLGCLHEMCLHARLYVPLLFLSLFPFLSIVTVLTVISLHIDLVLFQLNNLSRINNQTSLIINVMGMHRPMRICVT